MNGGGGNTLRDQADVEIYFMVKGRLPNKQGDELTSKICNRFITKFKDTSKYNLLVSYAIKRSVELQK